VLVLHEVLLGGLAHQVRALEMNADDGVPVLLGELEQQVVPRHARVVDQDVQATEPPDDRVDGALDAVCVAHVRTDADRVRRDLRGDLGRGRGCGRLVEVQQGDLRAVRRQPACRGGADPSCCAGDQCHAPVQCTHSSAPSLDRIRPILSEVRGATRPWPVLRC
jgi:hypothetical protein